MGAGASSGRLVVHCHNCSTTFKPEVSEIEVTSCPECGSDFLEHRREGGLGLEAVNTLEACAVMGDALSPEELLMNLAITADADHNPLQAMSAPLPYPEESSFYTSGNESLEQRMVARAQTLSMNESVVSAQSNHPTPQRVRSALPTLVVDRKFRWSQCASESRDCSICCYEITKGDTVRKLPCKHIFHQDCLMPWLEQQDFCPVCRVAVATQVTSTSQADSSGSSSSKTSSRKKRSSTKK
mmetsp:Transcript_25829/g.49043  ORF Transcript_25829/g.49043 Transcript_25829/m.49043 type:complete len:241 (-) Transcript_25829:157-879(-)|eukprot:CAMPEP_0114248058 /NCGR_PEP_ID=MMETSP0058-20121206/13359_1 /TAXON_ID=36894 /ORGANISM="Pyramimonas parkeae, CCMP726" /LENGTH=240 /DNA_ID=CAMNT_0001361417 /DNA_START=1110 /DNA_END=1832 /DNA_ORIENTATION=+